MHRAFQAAISPKEFVVLGLKLKPLTLGHCFLLMRAQSPFVCGGDVTPAYLSDAVFICAQDWEKSYRDSGKWWFRLWLLLWGFSQRNKDLHAECELLQAYFQEHLTIPPTGREAGRKRSNLNAPFIFRLLAIMRGEFGMSEAEAMSYPVTRANAMWLSLDERHGRVVLAEEDEPEFEAWCRAQDEQEVAE